LFLIERVNTVATGVVVRRKKEAFLREYAQRGIIQAAADAVGMHRNMHGHWMEQDPAYKEQFDAAGEAAADALEAEIHRRGVEGTETPWHYVPAVYSEGGTLLKNEQILTKKQYSETLLIFRMKALRPDKYRDNASMGIGPDGATVNLQVNVGTAPTQGANGHDVTAEAQEAEVQGDGTGLHANGVRIHIRGGNGSSK
jgi:hypothetical protein